MRSKVFRSWIQGLLLAGVFGIFALIGVLSLLTDDVVAKRDYFGIVLFSFFSIWGLWGIWRASRLGVRVGPDGLRIQGVGRDQLLPWSTITGVTVGPSDSRFGVPVYAPIITVAGTPDPMPVRPMSSYRQADAQRRADLLREYRARAGDVAG